MRERQGGGEKNGHLTEAPCNSKSPSEWVAESPWQGSSIRPFWFICAYTVQVWLVQSGPSSWLENHAGAVRIRPYEKHRGEAENSDMGTQTWELLDWSAHKSFSNHYNYHWIIVVLRAVGRKRHIMPSSFTKGSKTTISIFAINNFFSHDCLREVKPSLVTFNSSSLTKIFQWPWVRHWNAQCLNFSSCLTAIMIPTLFGR